MNDTLRTDTLLIAWDMSPDPKLLIEHARQLERELKEANECIAELKEELNESNGIIRLQHNLMTTAEKRCFAKYKEELNAANAAILEAAQWKEEQ